jgi:F5/8 type C domain/PA14 domain
MMALSSSFSSLLKFMKNPYPLCAIAMFASLISSPMAFAQGGNVAGKWQQQRFTGLTGSSLASLTESSAFYSAPTTASLVNSSYSALGDNYGARTRGYITPVTSGLYTFWVSGDDAAALSLSADLSKWNAQSIGSLSTYTAVNSYDEFSSQRSLTKYLIAGQSYFVELLHKEGGGADHAAVSWSMLPVDASVISNWASTAQGAVATQSSTYSASYPASNAIDGNLTTFSHTNNVTGSSLTVDFRQDRLLSSIELINRQSCCQTRLSNFRVSLLDSLDNVVIAKDYYTLTGSMPAAETWSLPSTVLARRIKVQFLGPNRENNNILALAEIQAFGPATTVKNWTREAGVVMSQSTAYSASYPASLAVDGNPNTFNHTADVAGSFLLSDLGADRIIDSVELLNRLDSTTLNRLSNFRISILSAANAVIVSQDYNTAGGNVKNSLRWELPTAVTGRKVKVELLGANRAGNYLFHIAELNVWGRANSTLSERGLRTLVPAAVMSSYDASLTDDLDDDGMLDLLELTYGLNPADGSDALGDLDNDGFNNILEIRANANPAVKDSIAGNLLDEIWLNSPGDKLTYLAYKAAFTRNPDIIDNVTTTQAFDKGENYTRRIRGYITAPSTGTYQFWGAADDDFSLYLSTTASKFDRALIINNNVLSWGENYDIDISQKSRTIDLVAGQKYYFEIWHKEGIVGSMVSIAWKIPGGIRNLIPAIYLSSYAGEINDQDDDYLKDDYELANGLSITDNAKTPGSLDGAYGDLDGDGLTNLEEQTRNTKANVADSDGDGISDYDEVNFFDSTTLANNIGAFSPVLTLNGDAYINAVGNWEKFDNKAQQACRRGSVTYAISVPTSGYHAAKFTITALQDGEKNEQHDFDLRLNGTRIAYKTITILPDGTATLALLTPWLQAGESYNLELFVDNSYNSRRVSIDQLEILAPSGADSNNNGTPDWSEIRLHDTNGFDLSTINSKTSPATLEGNLKFPELLNSHGAIINQAPNGRFFTETALTPGVATTVNFDFENNSLSETATVNWLPTNLRLENNLTVRQGDSLLLTAFADAENASLESYSFTVNGNTVTNAADQPTPQLFASAGTTTIIVSHTDSSAITTTRNVTINVLPQVTIPAPLCVTGYPRLWTHPALPAGVSLQIDDRMSYYLASANTYNISSAVAQHEAMIIRHTATGFIIGSSHIKNVSLRTSAATGNKLLSYTATHTEYELPIVVTGDLSSAEIRCNTLIGGVTFTDGTSVKSLYTTDFDVMGTASYSMKITNGSHSNCHRISVWYNGDRVMLSH